MSHGEANAWQPRSILQLSSDTKRIEERFIATANQVSFNLTTFSYTTGLGSLAVYRDGSFQAINAKWVENSITSFSLITPAAAGEEIVAVGYVAIEGNLPVVAGAYVPPIQEPTILGSATTAGLITLANVIAIPGVNSLDIVINGSTLTFGLDYAIPTVSTVQLTVEPNDLDEINIQEYRQVDISTLVAEADNVTYMLPATGANSRSVASKLNEVISIEDFSDLVVSGDWTAAVQAAADYAGLLAAATGSQVSVIGSQGKAYNLATFTTLTSTGVAEVRKYAISVPAGVAFVGNMKFTYAIDNAALGFFVQVFSLKGSNIEFDGPIFRNTAPGAQTGSIAIAMNTKHDDDIRTGTFKNLRIANCKFYDNIFATQVYFRDWGTSTMRNYVVEESYCLPGVAGNTGAFDAHGNEGTRMQGVKYLGNEVEGGTNASSYNCVGVQNIVVANNSSKDNLYAACQIENNCDDVTITGNDFSSEGAASVYGATVWIDDSSNVVIQGNTLRGNSDNKKLIYITHEGFTESVDGVSQDHTAYVTDNITVGKNAMRGGGILSSSFGGGGGGSIGTLDISPGVIDGAGVGLANVVQLKGCAGVNWRGGTIKGGTSNSLQIDTIAGQVTNVSGVTTLDGGDGGEGYNLLSGAGTRMTNSCIFNNGINLITGSYHGINDGSGLVTESFNGTLRIVGFGNPEGSVTGPPGSTYQRTAAIAGLSFYTKDSGTGNTGWIALS